MIFLICVLATWRLTHMLRTEDGPFHVFSRGRELLIPMEDDEPKNPDSFFAQLFACFLCLSVWVAIPFAVYLTTTLVDFLIYTLALSAGAIFLHYVEDKL